MYSFPNLETACGSMSISNCCFLNCIQISQEAGQKKVKVKLLSRVWLFANPWTVPARLLCPWDFPGKNTGAGCHFLLQGIFPTQGSNLGLLNCRQTLYHLSYQGSRPLSWYLTVKNHLHFQNWINLLAVDKLLKNDRMISVLFHGKPFNITVIQVCIPASNAEEVEERFY